MTADVLVVGGGPVGLLLACRLEQLGVAYELLEAAPAPRRGSRAIGIHPPSLDLLRALGLEQSFVAEGVRVTAGRVFSTRRDLGSVDLARTGRQPLTLPQARTEALLEDHLAAPPVRGARLVALAQDRDGVTAVVRRGGRDERRRARFAVGCDGRSSAVRDALGAELVGARRTGSYAMGDFDDDTALGRDAALYLADDGLVESFPLPSGRRRWVAETPRDRREPSASELAELVEARTGHRPRAETAALLSSFGVEQRRATRVVGGRVLLAGDAAHVISPFGGQGMNLGWRDAWDAAACLARTLGGADRDAVLRGYARRVHRAARCTLRRAAFNTYLGRRPRFPRARNAAVCALLHAVPQSTLARLFTMGPLLPFGADVLGGTPASPCDAVA